MKDRNRSKNEENPPAGYGDKSVLVNITHSLYECAGIYARSRLHKQLKTRATTARISSASAQTKDLTNNSVQ